ncbi:MAG: hypothetical protein J5601_00165, partial [Elusimicrobiaceae bacterium]|nr:hypothetical protein [Elusimicrobiaceae bacterium]
DGTILYRPTRRMLWRNDEGVSFVVEPSDAFVKSKEIPTTVQIDVIADIMSDEISPVSLVTPATTLEKFENNLFYGEKQRKYIDMGMLPVLEPKKYITPEMRADEELFLQARAQQMMHEPMRYDPTSRMPAPATAPKGIDPACLAKAQRFEYMYQISEGPRFIDLARVIKPFTLPNGQKVNVGDYVQLTGYNGLIIVFKESDVEKNLRDTAPQEKRGGTKPFIL